MECNVTNVKRLAVIGTTQIAKSHVDAARKAGFDVCHVAGSKNSFTVDGFAASNSIRNVWKDPIGLNRVSGMQLLLRLLRSH